MSNLKETSFTNPKLSLQPRSILVSHNGSLVDHQHCKIDKRIWPNGIAQSIPKAASPSSSPFLFYLKSTPITLLFGFFMICVWFYCWNYKVDVSTVGINYPSVAKHHELYRLFSASFSHLDILHIGMNLSSLFNLASIETSLGSIRYF